jgi:hypothetical protein
MNNSYVGRDQLPSSGMGHNDDSGMNGYNTTKNYINNYNIANSFKQHRVRPRTHKNSLTRDCSNHNTTIYGNLANP